MGTGYVRQSAADIVDGLPITAAPLNNEFNKVKDAFDATVGHAHDGTSGNGPKIVLTAAAGVSGTLPIANGGTSATTAAAARTALGLGTGSTQNANAVAITGGTITGITTLGASAAAITGGTISGTPISGSTVAGTSVTTANAQITGGSITGATLTGTTVTTAAATITGGTITGITDLAIADGGTGASTAAVARTNLGLVIGTDVQAQSGALTSISSLVTSANLMLYTTASNVYATTSLTPYGRTVIAAADATAVKTLLALTKTDVGLANVDNTSDVNKPISTAQGLLLSGFADKIINSDFLINQRNITSGAFAAGVYVFDRFKAGAGGVTFSAAVVGNATTLTITAGTLVQVIEAGAIEPGDYFLQWTGTAQGRINTGSYGATGISATGLTGTSNVTVEWNTGTLRLPQFTRTLLPYPIGKRHPQIELALCQRYFEICTHAFAVYAAAAGATSYIQVQYKVNKRATPTLTLITVGSTGNYSSNNLTVGTDPLSGARITQISSGAGVVAMSGMTFSSDAEL